MAWLMDAAKKAEAALNQVDQVGGDDEDALAAHLHGWNALAAEDALVPSFDDLPDADFELERGSSGVGAVEDTTIREPAGVVRLDDGALRGFASGANDSLAELQAGGGGLELAGALELGETAG